jgi:hypothetical protein
MAQSQPFVDYPVLQVRPNTLLVYVRREWNPVVLEAAKTKRAKESTGRKKSQPALPDLFRSTKSVQYLPALMRVSTSPKSEADSLTRNFRGRKAYSGEITEHSRKRLKRAINLLIAQAQWKTATDYKSGKEYKFLINFVTLTLPAAQGKITDKEVKTKVLDPWLKKAKRKWNLKSYVWRAERQGNGNIHFHITADVFIPYQELQNTWNDNLEALGLITEFEKVHGHRNPNSTDVHSVNKISNIAGYILKYMSKDIATKKDLQIISGAQFAHGTKAKIKAQKLLAKILNLSDVPLKGKVWDCSMNLKNQKNCELFLEGDQEEIWQQERKKNPARVIDKDRFSCITYSRSEFLKMLRGPIKARWNEYITGIRDHVPKPKNAAEESPPLQSTGTDCPF